MKKKIENSIILVALGACLLVLVLSNFGFKDIKQDNKPVTMSDYNKIIANKDTAVLAYFHASWCMVCAKVAPVIESIESQSAAKLKVLRIDTDRDKEVANQFEVDALPVLMLYKQGQRQWIHMGIIDERSLRAKLDASLK